MWKYSTHETSSEKHLRSNSLSPVFNAWLSGRCHFYKSLTIFFLLSSSFASPKLNHLFLVSSKSDFHYKVSVNQGKIVPDVFFKSRSSLQCSTFICEKHVLFSMGIVHEWRHASRCWWGSRIYWIQLLSLTWTALVLKYLTKKRGSENFNTCDVIYG